jgi:hypothetical protein
MPKSRTMPRRIHKELRSNFVRASRAGKRAARTEARARFVVYRPREHALRIELTNGVAIALPVKLIPDLRRAARRDVRAVEILAEAAACIRKAWTVDPSTSAFPVSFPPSLPDQSGWQNSTASAGEISSAAKAAAARRNRAQRRSSAHSAQGGGSGGILTPRPSGITL